MHGQTAGERGAAALLIHRPELQRLLGPSGIAGVLSHRWELPPLAGSWPPLGSSSSRDSKAQVCLSVERAWPSLRQILADSSFAFARVPRDLGAFGGPLRWHLKLSSSRGHSTRHNTASSWGH